MAESSGSGKAFADRDAARTLISSMYTDPSEADVGGQVNEAMENDGIYVISTEHEVRGVMQSACADPELASMPECTNY